MTQVEGDKEAEASLHAEEEEEEEEEGAEKVPDEDELTRLALQRLEDLCFVLGISYRKKLSEFGAGKLDMARVDGQIRFLRATRSKNFTKLQAIAHKMVDAWKTGDAPLKRMQTFAWILSVRDASSPDDITVRNMLSTDFVNKARKEVTALEMEKIRKVKDRYLVQKRKLMGLLSETHLVPGDVGFDPVKEVNEEQYRREKRDLKQSIKLVKAVAPERKELVLRVELVRKAVKQKFSMEELQDLIDNARKAAVEIGDGLVLYDGKDVMDMLEGFKKEAVVSFALAEQRAKSLEASTASRKRSGLLIPPEE